jgi:hypothetical protein
MRVQITKRPDGAGLLRCVRHDGSQAWQKQSERHAAHFALHDLTHFAVESTLGYQNGFFGLLKQGWDMADVTGKGARGPLPRQAIEVEEIVGLFDMERASRGTWTSTEFNNCARIRADNGSSRILTNEEIVRIRDCRNALFARWAETPEGGVLELQF